MQNLSYRFHYSTEGDNIKFSLKLGLQKVSITLETESFLAFADSMATSGRAFLERVKKKKAEGAEEDVEFNLGEWDRLMDKSEEQENGNKTD